MRELASGRRGGGPDALRRSRRAGSAVAVTRAERSVQRTARLWHNRPVMSVWLPATAPARRLVVGIVASVLLPRAAGRGLYFRGAARAPRLREAGRAPPRGHRAGQAQEPAPLGRPDRPVEPDRPTPPAAPGAPRGLPAAARRARLRRPAPAPAPPPAKAPRFRQPGARSPGCERSGARAGARAAAPERSLPEPGRADKPTIDGSQIREQAPRTRSSRKPGAPRLGLSAPAWTCPQRCSADPRAAGTQGGRGGVEGEPVPLDSPDPKYAEYFDLVREKIRENWGYPREAADRGIEGQLLIEFHIAETAGSRTSSSGGRPACASSTSTRSTPSGSRSRSRRFPSLAKEHPGHERPVPLPDRRRLLREPDPPVSAQRSLAAHRLDTLVGPPVASVL